MLPLRQKREALLTFGVARIGRTKKFERQSSDKEDERVVEFLLAGLGSGLVSTNADQMNLVRIEVPIRNFDGVGGLSVFIHFPQHGVRSGDEFFFDFAEQRHTFRILLALIGGASAGPLVLSYF